MFNEKPTAHKVLLLHIPPIWNVLLLHVVQCLPDLPEYSTAFQEGEGSIGCCSIGCNVEAFHEVCQIVGGRVIHIGFINDHINLHIHDTASQLLHFLHPCAVQTLLCRMW